MRTAFLAAALAGLFGVAAQAQTVALPPSAVVAARQGGFALLGANMGDLKRAVDAKAEVKPLKANAEAIVAWAKAIPSLFPAGTETNTKALPAVWSDRAGFEKAAATLAGAAEGLVKAADSGDAAAFAAAYQQTGSSCGGCHRPFRAR